MLASMILYLQNLPQDKDHLPVVPESLLSQKVLFDGRTKEYRQHREKLEAQREKRTKLREKQKSKFVEEILYKY